MPQSFARVNIHLVFSTKHRKPFLFEGIQDELHRYLGGVIREHGGSPVRMGGVEDHVHLLFGLSRTMTIAQTVEKVKTASSVWLKTKSPILDSFQWQKGYGAFSVYYRDLDRVVGYIENQKRHHRKKTFKQEYIQHLEENGLAYDERYVWD
jgi:REP element-mobilizing transposase RayT